MSDTDPTPLTPVTIGDRLGWFRGDLDARLAALSLQLATQHTELLAKLDSISGNVTLAQLLAAIQADSGTYNPTLNTILGYIEPMGGNVAQILLSLGGYLSDPAHYTIKQLLAMIRTDIGGALTPSILNEDVNPCAGYWEYIERIASWTTVGNGALINGANYDIYAPNLGAGGPYIIPDSAPYVAIGRADFFDANPIGSINVCGSWNFTGRADIPSVIKVLGNAALGAWPSGIDPATGAALTGHIPNTLQGHLEIMGYRVAVPYGAPPPELNFWWHYTGYTGAS
jgi:hypothetical protein